MLLQKLLWCEDLNTHSERMRVNRKVIFSAGVEESLPVKAKVLQLFAFSPRIKLQSILICGIRYSIILSSIPLGCPAT
jgi:hypothetical protein